MGAKRLTVSFSGQEASESNDDAQTDQPIVAVLATL
jgi:hypothetical protein